MICSLQGGVDLYLSLYFCTFTEKCNYKGIRTPKCIADAILLMLIHVFVNTRSGLALCWGCHLVSCRVVMSGHSDRQTGTKKIFLHKHPQESQDSCLIFKFTGLNLKQV